MNRLSIWLTPNKKLVEKIIIDPKEVIDTLKKFLLVEEKLEIRKARLNKKMGVEACSPSFSIEKQSKKMKRLRRKKELIIEAEQILYSTFPDRKKLKK